MVLPPLRRGRDGNQKGLWGVRGARMKKEKVNAERLQRGGEWDEKTKGENNLHILHKKRGTKRFTQERIKKLIDETNKGGRGMRR